MSSSVKRKDIILYRARVSRAHWINDADDESENVVLINDNPIQAANTLQDVFSFLDEIIGDHQSIRVDSLISLIDGETIAKRADGMSSYSYFLEKLKSPLAQNIVKSIQEFISKTDYMIKEIRKENHGYLFENHHKEISDRIFHFLEDLTLQILSVDFFWENDPVSERDLCTTHCEKFLFMKLYNSILEVDEETRQANQKLFERITSLQFLSASHLDISPLIDGDNTNIVEAVRQLRIMELKKCPTDKLACVKQCCNCINQALLNESSSSNGNNPPGADDILPHFILVLIQASLPTLASQTLFMQMYTPNDRLASETGYLLTTLLSAVHFLKTLDNTSLTLSSEEFEYLVNTSRSKYILDHKSVSKISVPVLPKYLTYQNIPQKNSVADEVEVHSIKQQFTHRYIGREKKINSLMDVYRMRSFPSLSSR